jgi:hypothetical protein
MRYFLFLHIFQLLNKNGHELIKDVLMMNLFLEEKKPKILGEDNKKYMMNHIMSDNFYFTQSKTSGFV